MNNEEKVYFFNLAKPDGTNETLQIPESQLTQHQKDLLLSEVINHFLSLPPELQNQFILSIRIQPNKATC